MFHVKHDLSWSPTKITLRAFCSAACCQLAKVSHNQQLDIHTVIHSLINE